MEYFFVYILRCSDGSYYVGHTDDIEKRISMHRSGVGSSYTSSRLPMEPVFVQQFASRDQAIEMERKIKGWTRSKKEALINGDWDRIALLAKKKFD